MVWKYDESIRHENAGMSNRWVTKIEKERGWKFSRTLVQKGGNGREKLFTEKNSSSGREGERRDTKFTEQIGGEGFPGVSAPAPPRQKDTYLKTSVGEIKAPCGRWKKTRTVLKGRH